MRTLMRQLANIFWLGTRSCAASCAISCCSAWSSIPSRSPIIAQAQSTSQELHNASIAIVDEDHSQLSRRIATRFCRPISSRPQPIAPRDIDRLMNAGRYTFVIDIPPHFERDVLAGRQPAIQVNVDATAMMQAGIGAGYAQQIIADRDRATSSRTPRAIRRRAGQSRGAHRLQPQRHDRLVHQRHGIINNVTMLAIILAGAAIVREREHGTMDHLLVMPLTPFEIAMAKVWANGLVITVAVALSLTIVVRRLLDVPIAGSMPLFMLGVVLYLFFATAVGIFLGTVARSMPQLGLLYILVALPMNMLSGGNTPLESMPPWLATIMQVSPSTHFVSFAQSILYRGAGLDVVWPQFLLVAGSGGLFLLLAIRRFPLDGGNVT